MEFRFIDPVRDFSDGMAALRHYHEDFLVRGKRLLALAKMIDADGINESLAYQCVEMHCYYTRANNLHHRDEEHVLFPLIVNRSELVDGMIERLALDHEEIERSWCVLAEFLSRPECITNSNALLAAAADFEKLQREHLLRENEDFLPYIEKLLDKDQHAVIGRKMAAMRKVA